MSEWFRKNAGVVVFNKHKKVLLCKRVDVANSWQFPQGGIEENESPSEAGKRELFEETSIKSVELIKTLANPVRYYFTPEIIASMKKRGFTNSGQDIYWSLFYFYGDETEINLQTEHPEFVDFKWGTLVEAEKLIVEFKKQAYVVAKEEFEEIIARHEIR